jgi:hypothetical protein
MSMRALVLSLVVIAAATSAEKPPPPPPVDPEPQPRELPISAEETWLLERLAEVRTLKPGVSKREDVDAVLEHVRGIYTRTTQRYALYSCRFIKVTVTYRENPTDDESQDVVESVSAPTITDAGR